MKVFIVSSVIAGNPKICGNLNRIIKKLFTCLHNGEGYNILAHSRPDPESFSDGIKPARKFFNTAQKSEGLNAVD